MKLGLKTSFVVARALVVGHVGKCLAKLYPCMCICMHKCFVCMNRKGWCSRLCAFVVCRCKEHLAQLSLVYTCAYACALSICM